MEAVRRTTRLRDIRGVAWHIPNGRIDRVGNKPQKWSRVLVDIEVVLRHGHRLGRRGDQERTGRGVEERGVPRRTLEEPELLGG